MRLLGLLIGSAIAVALGYVIAQESTVNDEPTVREILYWPLVGAQLLAMLLAIAMTTNSIALERQRQTWDSLKLTLVGVGLTLRARWISVFLRLWWLLAAVTVGRLVYVGFLLDDLTENQGRALDLHIYWIEPEVTLDAAILLLTALVTGFILLPFVGVAIGAALGLLLALLTRSRAIVILGLLVLMGLRVVITAAGLVIGDNLITETGVSPEVIDMTTGSAWAQLLFFSIEGDMGLKLMELDTLGEIWADVENGIYLGGVFLAIVLLYAIVSNLIVLLVARLAARPSKV
jgi:hypothetical protein